MNDITVSIACLAYNHEKYIRQAIESFLAQKTQYSYEIVINDDASTDGTSEIIKEYEEKYPQKVRGIFHKENQYKEKESFIIRDLYKECKGKYIAFCECDDFWLDNRKLQMQIEYLESHPECIMTTHNAIVIDCRTQKVFSLNPYERDGFLEPKDIILQQKGNLPTASLVFRKEATLLDDFFLESGVGDWPIQLYAMTKGKLYYFDRIMSAYRHNHEGSWSNETFGKREKQCIHSIRMIQFLIKYNVYTNFKYNNYIVGRMQGYLSSIIWLYRDMPIRIGIQHFKELDKKENYIYSKYFKEVIKEYQQVFDIDYYDEKLYKFVNEYENIIVWGIGNYGLVIARRMKKANLAYKGFVISDKEIENLRFFGKPVWNLNKIPFEKQNTGIIIAIDPKKWHDLESILKKEGVNNYYCPFLIEWEKMQ